MYIPYSDITEVNGMYGLTPGRLELYEAEVRTPLGFISYANRYGDIPKVQQILADSGWVETTSCLNWHSSHNGDAQVRLWLKKFLKNLPLDKPQYRTHSYSQHLSFASGCCGRIIEPHEIADSEIVKVNPLYWSRYLTILRVPTEKSVDTNWLRAMNYRPLPQFSTSVADYWVNGFQDWTRDAELAFWDKWKRPEQQGEKRATLKQS